jgi:hypothetical protein
MRLILRFLDAVPIRVMAQFQHLVDFPRLAFGFEVSSSKYSAVIHGHRVFSWLMRIRAPKNIGRLFIEPEKSCGVVVVTCPCRPKHG